MPEPPKMDRTQVKISTLRAQGTDALITGATPAELMTMVWPLTLEAWAFKEPAVAKLRFQRDVVRVVRGGC